MIIDAHQHFWRLARGDYSFPRPGDAVLYRDFEAADLEPLLERFGVSGTILVQATDTLEETAHLLEIAAEVPFVAGVVGWWDPRAERGLPELLALKEARRLVGLRPMLQKYDDISWLVDDKSLQDLAAITAADLVFDALVDVRHLDQIASLCRTVPQLRVVIDHMGKPWRHPESYERWQAGMRALAAHRNCFVKISGFPFGTEAAPSLRAAGLYAQLDSWFGPARLVWGSDWPVVEREGGYGMALTAMKDIVPAADHKAVFHANAVSLYRLDGWRDRGAA